MAIRIGRGHARLGRANLPEIDLALSPRAGNAASGMDSAATSEQVEEVVHA